MLQSHDVDSLVSVSSLPQPFQPVFKFRYFNAVQSESFAEAFLFDQNMVISAPTGSGKTGLFELCILRLLSRDLTPDGHFMHVRGSYKIVYMGPLKALVQEVTRKWTESFGQVLGLNCLELTGDTSFLRGDEMQETDIILTTPEKFDSITRHHHSHGGVGFFGDIALLLIDEVHLLHDSRGAALEAVVSRLKMLGRLPELKGSPVSSIRFIAVSATLPNIEDLAEWLKVPQRGIKRFGEEMRPVKLTTKVYGYSPAKNDFLFEKGMTDGLPFLLSAASILSLRNEQETKKTFKKENKFARKGAQDAAQTLADTVTKPGMRNPFIKSQEQYERLQLASAEVHDKIMQSCVANGVAFHNGGLGAADRDLVEGLFLNGDLQVLCTTSTLAQGVNLPAHLVVIKSTQYFNQQKGRYVEQERSTLLQMCGRAGRPQFDDSGVVVLMTKNETVHLYEDILSGSEPVESELLPFIAEHLNAEIFLMTVSDVGLAIDWLKCSYLYVRMRKHPQHYKIEKDLTEEQMEKHMKGICLQSINELAKHGMISMDEYGFTLKPLEPGRLMAKYYLSFETMKGMFHTPTPCTMAELIQTLSKAHELTWIQLRRHEKKLMNSINQDSSGRIKFHILGQNGKTKKRIQTSYEKIFLLVNDVLSDEPSQLDFSLSQDVNGICTNGARIARCMSEYFKHLKRFEETKYSTLLGKCLRHRLWYDSFRQLKQLPGIGTVTVKVFQAAGIDSFEKLSNADPRRLETITGRKFPYGDQVKESLSALPPKVDLIARESGFRVGAKQEYPVIITRTSLPKANRCHFADLIIGDGKENTILIHERIRLDQFDSPYETRVLSANGVRVDLICEDYVGLDISRELVNRERPKTAMSSFGRHRTSNKNQRETQVSKDETSVSTLAQSQPVIDNNPIVEQKLHFPSLVNVSPNFSHNDRLSGKSGPATTIQVSKSPTTIAASEATKEGGRSSNCLTVTPIPPKVQGISGTTTFPMKRRNMGTESDADTVKGVINADHAATTSRAYNVKRKASEIGSPQRGNSQMLKLEHATFGNGRSPLGEFTSFGPCPTFDLLGNQAGIPVSTNRGRIPATSSLISPLDHHQSPARGGHGRDHCEEVNADMRAIERKNDFETRTVLPGVVHSSLVDTNADVGFKFEEDLRDSESDGLSAKHVRNLDAGQADNVLTPETPTRITSVAVGQSANRRPRYIDADDSGAEADIPCGGNLERARHEGPAAAANHMTAHSADRRPCYANSVERDATEDIYYGNNTQLTNQGSAPSEDHTISQAPAPAEATKNQLAALETFSKVKSDLAKGKSFFSFLFDQ